MNTARRISQTMTAFLSLLPEHPVGAHMEDCARCKLPAFCSVPECREWADWVEQYYTEVMGTDVMHLVVQFPLCDEHRDHQHVKSFGARNAVLVEHSEAMLSNLVPWERRK